MTACSNLVAREDDFFGHYSQKPAPHRYMDKAWRRYVKPLESLTYYTREGLLSDETEEMAGVYFLFKGDLRYVGMSLGIKCRAMQHIWRGRHDFDLVGILSIDHNEMDLMPMVEMAYICATLPPGNAKFGPISWAGHERMVRIIRRLWRRNEA